MLCYKTLLWAIHQSLVNPNVGLYRQFHLLLRYLFDYLNLLRQLAFSVILYLIQLRPLAFYFYFTLKALNDGLALELGQFFDLFKITIA